VGASQFITSDQFEQYLKLGRDAIDEAFERQAALEQEPRVFRVEPETTVNVDSLNSMRKMEETNDRFMRWKAGVDQAAAASENRKIVARILKENPKFDLSAWPSASAFLFYRHAHKLNGAPDPKEFGFRDDNDATFSFQGGYPHYHHDRPAGSIRQRDWKLIEYLDGTGDIELYQIGMDIGETKNLVAERPGRVADMMKQLKAWRENVLARIPIPNPSYDPNRAAEWWSIRSGKPIDSDNRKRFPATEKDQ
jgi:hypothetical protein